MPELIGLDFETYGAESLPVHGLFRYVSDPSFKVLLGSTSLRVNSRIVRLTMDFVDGDPTMLLKQRIGDRYICAHSAIFERMVLRTLGLDYPASRFIDSAVVARAAGGSSHLMNAAPQLLNVNKMEAGRDLIKLFSIPSKEQLARGQQDFDPQIIADHPQEWNTFKDYCELDSELSLRIVEDYQHWLTTREMAYQAITMDMNMTGWCVDLDVVKEMQRRYEANLVYAQLGFRQRNAAPDLNLNSLKQMKEWCSDRGVRATSFAEKPIERLRKRLVPKIANLPIGDPKRESYTEVLDLVQTKQVLGGSSLKKLQVIIDTAHANGHGVRLHDQYVHCGAGQTLRTTGRSAQMQNLKRLTTVEDMDELDDEDVAWDNDKLAENLRQVFTATDPKGRLIVGDFKSVESRGLAWLADEAWKVQAYRRDQDLYKVLAGKIYTGSPANVDKLQRQTGKVGELSCGYGAGPDAVVSFAEGMGVELEHGEATRLVYSWRDANPMIVKLWNELDEMLHNAVSKGSQELLELPDGLTLELRPCATPASLQQQAPGVGSLRMMIVNRESRIVMQRYFHGCYERGRNICYYKPSDRKTGDHWKQEFIDPKTKLRRRYELYGGKLSGILTQSFCRELFFESLYQVHEWTSLSPVVQLVGQFHDEIVVDWKPGGLSLDMAKSVLNAKMTGSSLAPSFPLAADIKDDYRYTK